MSSDPRRKEAAATADVDKLRRLVARLRAPGGCPWDREQGMEDVRAFLLEEAHEVAAAIDGGDREELKSELGDLLFQAVFASALAEEEGAFTLGDVIDAAHAKMVERHPHVFGETAAGEKPADAAAVRRAWERRKLGDGGAERSVLAGVPATLPALTAAHRMTQKAGAVGFDWPDAGAVVAKVREELAEVEEARAGGGDRDRRTREEIGDLLFAVANLARHLGIDAEAALAGANGKFKRRFEALEGLLAEKGESVADATLEELDEGWEEVKRRERRR